MQYHIQVKQFEATPTAVIRARLRKEELSKFVPAVCGEVWIFFRSNNLPKPGRNIALYRDDGRGSIEVEAGAEVREQFAGNDRVHCSELPAGSVATLAHFGPYSRLGEAYDAIREHCSQRTLRLSNTSWEIYGHWQESWNNDPSKIRTDVFCLLNNQ